MRTGPFLRILTRLLPGFPRLLSGRSRLLTRLSLTWLLAALHGLHRLLGCLRKRLGGLLTGLRLLAGTLSVGGLGGSLQSLRQRLTGSRELTGIGWFSGGLLSLLTELLGGLL